MDAAVAASLAAVVVILIAARDETDAKAPDALAFGLGLAIGGMLLVRRRAPLAVFLASAVAVVGYHALDYPAIGLAVPLAPAAYTAAESGHVRVVVAVFAALEAWAIAWRALGEDQSILRTVGEQTLFEVALITAVLLLVEALRSRRAWLAETTERLRLIAADREREAERRVEQERLRIAREMHDVLAHTIAVIGVQAGVADEALADSPEEAHASLRTIRAKSREAMSELRATVGVLREPRDGAPTAPAPGLARLSGLVETAAAANVRVAVETTGGTCELPAVVDMTAYRIVQEALTNVLRHADAHVATVSIAYRPGAVVIDVCDDGRGGDAAGSNGHGVAGMHERAAAVGGELEAGPAEAGGFRVRAVLPTGLPST